MVVYFNGRFAAKEEVCVSPDDRGFLFGDGVYEVVSVYGGRMFRPEDHWRRLARSLQEIELQGPDEEALAGIARRLIEANGLAERDALVYVQVTRGVGPRAHVFPEPGTPPTVYACASPFRPPREKCRRGVGVILVPDVRWARCDIKSLSLLPNVLTSQRARESGAEEAVFVRDGVITEGSHTNVGAVFEGRLATHPRSNVVLPGVTRAVVLELCGELGIPWVERPILEQELGKADEVMLMGTTSEVMPVVRVDGRPVGEGRPGPIAGRLQRAFWERVG